MGTLQLSVLCPALQASDTLQSTVIGVGNTGVPVAYGHASVACGSSALPLPTPQASGIILLLRLSLWATPGSTWPVARALSIDV